jgi:hypothetical protein
MYGQRCLTLWFPLHRRCHITVTMYPFELSYQITKPAIYLTRSRGANYATVTFHAFHDDCSDEDQLLVEHILLYHHHHHQEYH